MPRVVSCILYYTFTPTIIQQYCHLPVHHDERWVHHTRRILSSNKDALHDGPTIVRAMCTRPALSGRFWCVGRPIIDLVKACNNNDVEHNVAKQRGRTRSSSPLLYHIPSHHIPSRRDYHVKCGSEQEAAELARTVNQPVHQSIHPSPCIAQLTSWTPPSTGRVGVSRS